MKIFFFSFEWRDEENVYLLINIFWLTLTLPDIKWYACLCQVCPSQGSAVVCTAYAIAIWWVPLHSFDIAKSHIVWHCKVLLHCTCHEGYRWLGLLLHKKSNHCFGWVLRNSLFTWQTLSRFRRFVDCSVHQGPYSVSQWWSVDHSVTFKEVI